jgi:hypothetical protein
MPIDNMSRQTFTMLYLDLGPSGDHVFKTSSSSNTTQKPDIPPLPDRDTKPLVLTSHEQRLLSLSDAIARTRVAAAKNVGSSANSAFWIGLSALIVSGFTTLFVTLQSRGVGSPSTEPDVRPAPVPEAPSGGAAPPPGGPAPTPPSERRAGRGRLSIIALLAIILSIAGTVLAGMKQFYDPTRLVIQNGRAIQNLNRLHQAVTQGFECKEGDKPVVDYVDENSVKKWTLEIETLRGSILSSYGALSEETSSAQRAP